MNLNLNQKSVFRSTHPFEKNDSHLCVWTGLFMIYTTQCLDRPVYDLHHTDSYWCQDLNRDFFKFLHSSLGQWTEVLLSSKQAVHVCYKVAQATTLRNVWSCQLNTTVTLLLAFKLKPMWHQAQAVPILLIILLGFSLPANCIVMTWGRKGYCKQPTPVLTKRDFKFNWASVTDSDTSYWQRRKRQPPCPPLKVSYCSGLKKIQIF